MPGEYKTYLHGRGNGASGESGRQDIPHWKPKEKNKLQEAKLSSSNDFLAHHGIPGMKWYHRRFQNKDGTLTPEGRMRYGNGDGDGNRTEKDDQDASPSKSSKSEFNSKTSTYRKDPQTLTDAELNKRLERMRKENEYKNLRKSLVPQTKSERRKEFWKKVMTDATSKMIADITKEVSKSTVNFIFKKSKEKRNTGNARQRSSNHSGS